MMKKTQPITLCQLINPFFLAWYLLCLAIITFFAYLDSPATYGDDAVHTYCTILESGDDSRAFTVPVSLLFMLPLFTKLWRSLVARQYTPSILIALLLVYWLWSFFGVYSSC